MSFGSEDRCDGLEKITSPMNILGNRYNNSWKGNLNSLQCKRSQWLRRCIFPETGITTIYRVIDKVFYLEPVSSK